MSLVTIVRPPAYAHGCVVIHRAGGRTGTGDPGYQGSAGRLGRGDLQGPRIRGKGPGTQGPNGP